MKYNTFVTSYGIIQAQYHLLSSLSFLNNVTHESYESQRKSNTNKDKNVAN